MYVIVTCYLCLSLSCVNVYAGCCIATVVDDRHRLGADRFHRHVDVYMFLFFLVNNLITATVITLLDGTFISWVLFLSYLNLF